MPIGLQERLLGEVFGVMVIAHSVVAVGVHVAQVAAIQLGEAGVEFGFVLWLRGVHRTVERTSAQAARTGRARVERWGLVTVAAHPSASMRPSTSAANPSSV